LAAWAALVGCRVDNLAPGLDGLLQVGIAAVGERMGLVHQALGLLVEGLSDHVSPRAASGFLSFCGLYAAGRSGRRVPSKKGRPIVVSRPTDKSFKERRKSGAR